MPEVVENPELICMMLICIHPYNTPYSESFKPLIMHIQPRLTELDFCRVVMRALGFFEVIRVITRVRVLKPFLIRFS